MLWIFLKGKYNGRSDPRALVSSDFAGQYIFTDDSALAEGLEQGVGGITETKDLLVRVSPALQVAIEADRQGAFVHLYSK